MIWQINFSLSLSLLVDQRKLILWLQTSRSDNVILRIVRTMSVLNRNDLLTLLTYSVLVKLDATSHKTSEFGKPFVSKQLMAAKRRTVVTLNSR